MGGPWGSSRSARSPRASPPLVGWPCPPSYAGCCATRAATCTPSSCGCYPAHPSRSRSNAGPSGESGSWALVVTLAVLFRSVIIYSFTTNEAGKTPLQNTNLSCGDLEPLWLEAQAVPSASQVPCVRPLPVGWSVAMVTVNDGRSVLTLDHDRAGPAALVVRLTAACDPSGAVQGPSATTGVRHYQRIQSPTGQFTATWYDQFPGGCVTSRLHLTTDPNGEFAAQAPQVLGFTTRTALQGALSQRSDGR